MKVCLIGFGKMGRAIEQQLLLRGHQVAYKLGRNEEPFLEKALADSDIAIEFSSPEAAVNHLKTCFKMQCPVICGTTGWTDAWDEIQDALKQSNSAFIFASNFSIGVQLFFELNRKLAQLMGSRPEYQCSIHEVHHTHKKDAPSGTAISLAQDIIGNHPNYSSWSLDKQLSSETLPIYSERKDPVVGIHQINYNSTIDTLEIKHTAHNRDGFALGAVLAAEFLIGKRGNFTMRDVLGLNSI
ncbi:MAG: 4-hydroxy-tetrahydrodipicolinate reductase [Saprospiraceae bacterium]|nr:4-hydroxy-tetrahydrodipicolinate reductase [Saprospiraceae bacterium]MBK7737054.1 4-hydroxy-tetrahydrodipicolinate reductase [Saprospiraceae bacterium]